MILQEIEDILHERYVNGEIPHLNDTEMDILKECNKPDTIESIKRDIIENPIGMMSITEAAKYIGFSEDTLRTLDKNGKLKALRTDGGHRRYTKEMLDEFAKHMDNAYDYPSLYEHLCSAQYIADNLGYENADAIMKIREDVGIKVLKIFEKNAQQNC